MGIGATKTNNRTKIHSLLDAEHIKRKKHNTNITTSREEKRSLGVSRFKH